MPQVFKFKVSSLTQESLVDLGEQFSLAHEYHKNLIEFDNCIRNKKRELLKSDAKYQEICKEIYILEQYIKEFKKIRDVSAETSRLKDEKKNKKEHLTCLFSPLNEEFNALRRAIRKDPTQRPFWGTYQLIDDIVKKSSQSTPLYKDGKENNLSYPFWPKKDTWAVGLQLQKRKYVSNKEEYLTTDYVYLQNGWFEITKPNDKAWFGSRAERRANNKTTCKLKIGNKKNSQWVNSGGNPIYATFEIVMHRPLPQNSYITNVVLRKSIEGPNKPEWYINITVNNNSNKCKSQCNDDLTIVDLGWKEDDASMRVMTYRQRINGKWGDIIHYNLSSEVISMFSYVKDTRSRRDKFTNKTLEILKNQYKNNVLSELLTNELKKRCVWTWKSPNGANRFLQFWKDHRYEGDAELFNTLKCRVKRNKHLHDHEFNLRKKASLRRREEYRILAAKLRRETSIIGLDKIQLAKIAKIDKDKDKNLAKKARGNRVSAAPSILRLALENAFGINVIDLPTKNSTKICHNCQSIENVGGKTIHTCSNCGQSWDRDENAIYNYTAYCERLGDLQSIITARTNEKRNKVNDMQMKRTAARLEKQKKNKEKREVLASEHVST